MMMIKMHGEINGVDFVEWYNAAWKLIYFVYCPLMGKIQYTLHGRMARARKEIMLLKIETQWLNGSLCNIFRIALYEKNSTIFEKQLQLEKSID